MKENQKPVRPAPVVADLGRPETPEETSARKAEASRKHRANQTLRNLIWALLASLAVVLFLVLVVVRPNPPAAEPIDYATVATQAQGDLPDTLVAPVLAPGWSANEAELRKVGDITVWYIGFITPDEQFIAFSQGIEANPTWVDNVLETAQPTGSTRIAGTEWVAYDNRDDDDPGNIAFALVTERDSSTFVLNGTASDSEFEELATALGEAMDD
jgi:hypothetical protein